MKMKIIFCIKFICIFYCAGCDYYDDRLIINNKSTKNIYVSINKDTVLSLGENKTFMFEDDFVKKSTKNNFTLPGSKKAWEFLAEKSLNKQLHIFILLEDTLKKYETSEIIKLKKYEKRIDIGIEELKAKNWEVIYD
jgi:hypothetical protein